MLMERLMKHFQENAQKTILLDGATGKTLTFGELDELTARVYGYLSEKGIGRESFVMINLPRGIYALAAAVGVWRAGAAYVLVEDGTPVEKRDYIYRDCGCTLMLRAEEFSEILSFPGKEGYAKTDLHDASYAVYTSGTTGNPKGVIHEYGTLEDNISHLRYNGKSLIDEDERFLLISPLSFVASTIVLNFTLDIGNMLILAPYTVVKNKEVLLSFMADHRVTATFFTPSLLQLNPKFHPELRKLFLSSEPAKNIYQDGIILNNVYAQSETGYLAGVFRLDKAYDITPIGKSQCPGREMVILDDNGEKLPPGELGEICFENPYFRGYMNLPGETDRAFHGGIYHTGDIGKMLPDGNVVLLGRNDDMVKVNGNRVEPAEIEKAMKEVLGLSWVAAKAFVEDDRVFICGYYTDDITVDASEAGKRLSKKLPAYMVPSHFIKLSEIPLNPNGKLSRKDLPRPDFSARSKAYVPPENETEICLCEAAAKVLRLDRVGALDDFYELGGDSISSMRLLLEAGLDGLTTDMVFRGRSAREIAKIYQNEVVSRGAENLRLQEERARGTDHPLLMEQLASFDYQLYAPGSTMWNLPLFFRLEKDADLKRLKNAVENVLKAHGVFSLILTFNDNGEIVQRYAPETDKSVTIEQVSEAEMVDIREELVRPFKLIDAPLFRFRIFETERGGYFFFDLHHLIGDGTSMYILLNEIAESYEGTPLKEDCYFANLSRLEMEQLTDNYAKARDYYTAREETRDWSRYPKPDHESSVKDLGGISFILPVAEEGYETIQKLYSVGKNGFFTGAAALALAAYNDEKYISVQWTYNGREGSDDSNIIGMLIRDITFYIEFEEGMTIGEFFREVKDQMITGLSYSSYPHANYIDYSSLCILYQSFQGETEGNGTLQWKEEELPKPYAANDNMIDLEIRDTENGTQFDLLYLPSSYEEESMQRFRRMLMKSACLLVQYAKDSDRKLQTLISMMKQDVFH
ncbi:MAG: AMP-binding protein [Lachnospiraceae bacterium]|nr:AMP-binding protein [Lachnospiraceae bacterium]